MNNLISFLTLAFLVANTFAQTSSETSNPSTPQPPLVADPRPGTGWTVQISRPPNQVAGSDEMMELPPPSDQPALITTQNGTNNRLDEIRWGDGANTVAYYTGAWCFMESRDGSRVIPFRIPSGSPDAGVSIFTRGYVGTEWIQPGLFKGTEELGGVLCHVYQRDPLPLPTVANPDPDAAAVGGHQNLIDSVALTAFIDAEIRRPVRIIIDSVNYDYKDWKSVPADIPMPEKIKPTFEAVKAQLGGIR